MFNVLKIPSKKSLFASLGRSVLRNTVPSVLLKVLSLCPWSVHKSSGTVFLNTDLPGRQITYLSFHPSATVVHSMSFFLVCAGNATSQYPTLLHFAAAFGLGRLMRTLESCLGALEACSIKNCNGHRPYNIADEMGFSSLGDELRTFHVSDVYCTEIVQNIT